MSGESDVNARMPPPTEPTIDIVDFDQLRVWMDRHGLGAGQIIDAELIAGGTQNVLVRFRRNGHEYVLRRPPRHKRANSDETMRRESRVLAALRGTAVPHPDLIAAEPDPAVLGAAFYLMGAVDGFNAMVELPAPHASSLAMQHEMGLSMADTLGALAGIDIEERRLLDLGRPDHWKERQVPRWRKQLDGYRDLAGYPGPRIPRLDDVGQWLEDQLPERVQSGLIHGDFHFGNVLMDRSRGAVKAVVDWELATVGDPLLDLGHLLSTWPRTGYGRDTPLKAAMGLPTPEEVIDRYHLVTGRDLTDLRWFRVLACYRLGIILEGSHARALSGLTPPAIGDQLHEHCLELFERAGELIDQ